MRGDSRRESKKGRVRDDARRMTSSTTSSKRAEQFARLNISENDSDHSTLQQSPGCDNRVNRSAQSGVHWIVEQSETGSRRSNSAAMYGDQSL
ncbi:hypothetical protein MJO28_005385 [Puccinia striiformis f. sp. tritici]|uniref:Uncharacterized protein n=1 Tax=Puccinia striiformis f. sp. tritici TaxID=168172 RepID=A0ACC0EKJ6_9BASI|nr:hypothetical protein MJO28_005385 [Puccinia striiformis f. sp. tritici]